MVLFLFKSKKVVYKSYRPVMLVHPEGVHGEEAGVLVAPGVPRLLATLLIYSKLDPEKRDNKTGPRNL